MLKTSVNGVILNEKKQKYPKHYEINLKTLKQRFCKK